MLQLTRKGEYAIKGIVFLASRDQDEKCSLSNIASLVDVPKTSLAKIFQQFSKAGLVKSVRGNGGGFTLGRAPQCITLLEVVEAVECTVTVNQCVTDAAVCHRSKVCGIHPVWAGVQHKVSSLLQNVTLKDLIAAK